MSQQLSTRTASPLRTTSPDNTQPPAHIESLLQAEGMSYDPAAFAAMSLEQHAEEGFKGLRVSVLSAVYSGMHFVAAKELSNQFESTNKHFVKEEAERRGVSYQTIYNMIEIYKLFERSPEKCAQTFANIGFTKLLEFKKFEQEELEQLAEGNEVKGVTLNAVQTMSVSEFKAALKEYAINNQPYRRLEKKLDEARKVILDKDAKLEMANKLTLHNGQPAIINNMRTLSTTITGEILRLLDALEDLEITLAKGVESGLSLESEKRNQQLRAGLIPWSINLNVIRARAQQINEGARSHFAADLFPQGAEDMVQLDELECISARSHYAFMTDLMTNVQLKQEVPKEKPKKKGAKK